jgi:hypothetical protein
MERPYKMEWARTRHIPYMVANTRNTTSRFWKCTFSQFYKKPDVAESNEHHNFHLFYRVLVNIKTKCIEA